VFVSRNLVPPGWSWSGPENLIILLDTDAVFVEHHRFPGLLSEDTRNTIGPLVALFPGSQDSGILHEGEEPPRIAVHIVFGTVILHHHCIAVIFNEMVFDLGVNEKRVHGGQKWRKVSAGLCSRLA